MVYAAASRSGKGAAVLHESPARLFGAIVRAYGEVLLGVPSQLRSQSRRRTISSRQFRRLLRANHLSVRKLVLGDAGE
jgi:hypothetical protein